MNNWKPDIIMHVNENVITERKYYRGGLVKEKWVIDLLIHQQGKYDYVYTK